MLIWSGLTAPASSDMQQPSVGWCLKSLFIRIFYASYLRTYELSAKLSFKLSGKNQQTRVKKPNQTVLLNWHNRHWTQKSAFPVSPHNLRPRKLLNIRPMCIKNEKRGTITTAVCIKHLHTHTCTHSTSNSLIYWSETPKAATPFPLEFSSSFIIIFDHNCILFLNLTAGNQSLKPLCGSESKQVEDVWPSFKTMVTGLTRPTLVSSLRRLPRLGTAFGFPFWYERSTKKKKKDLWTGTIEIWTDLLWSVTVRL